MFQIKFRVFLSSVAATNLFGVASNISLTQSRSTEIKTHDQLRPMNFTEFNLNNTLVSFG